MIITRPSFRWITVGIWLMPVTFAATAVCLLGACWREACLRWQSRELGFYPRTAVGWLWALVMALGAVATLRSVHPLESVFGWLAGLGYVVTFLVACWTVNTPGRLKQLHKALFWLATALAAFGLVVYAADWHLFWHSAATGMEIKIGTEDRRINSLMYHPNLLAGFLLLALAAGLGLVHQVRDWPRKGAYAAGLGAIALCLVLTQSRAGWIGAACLLLSFGLVVDRRWLLTLAGGAIAAYGLFPHMVAARLDGLSADNPAFDKYRVMAWHAAWRMIRERPLTGWGPGMWATVYPHFRLAEETRHLPHAHNYFLHVAVEFGVPVIVTLLGLIVWVIGRGIVATRRTQYHLPVLASACGLFGYLISNLFDYTLSEGRNAIAFFLLLGGIEAARRMAIADRPPELRKTIPAAVAPLPTPTDTEEPLV